MDSEEAIQIPLLIRRIMPDATAVQLPAATAIFEDYLAMAWKILKRLESEFDADRNSFKPP